VTATAAAREIGLLAVGWDPEGDTHADRSLGVRENRRG